MSKPQPATRARTCRACGKKFEYPVKGSNATRHHCEQCVQVPASIRVIHERLLAHIQKLETELNRRFPMTPRD